MKANQQYDNRNWSNWFLCLHQWSWTNTNLNNLQSALVNTDTESLESFSFDIRSLDWKIFTDHNQLGMRHYVLKNDPDSIESSHFLHRLIQLAFIFFVIYNLINVFTTWDVPSLLPSGTVVTPPRDMLPHQALHSMK